MTDLASLTNVSVQYGFYDGECVEIARSYLEGYTEDYFFFQYDDDDYCLILSDNGYMSGDSYIADNATVYQIRVASVVHHNEIPFTGNVSGSYNGVVGPTPSAGSFNSSSITGRSVYDTVEYNYFVDSYTSSTVLIANPSDFLCFSNLEGKPHLIEGVQNYAYAGFFLASCVCVFGLIDRVFSRVSRVR